MKKSEKLQLIEGKFSSEEASDILTNIFLTKIRFHEAKNFSSQVRFGKDDPIAKERIPELKKEFKKLLDILALAKESKKGLIINAEINIKLSN